MVQNMFLQLIFTKKPFFNLWTMFFLVRGTSFLIIHKYNYSSFSFSFGMILSLKSFHISWTSGITISSESYERVRVVRHENSNIQKRASWQACTILAWATYLNSSFRVRNTAMIMSVAPMKGFWWSNTDT